MALLYATPARADETARLTNALALEQIADVIQTESGELRARCRGIPDPQIPSKIAFTECAPPFVEADPLARPFVHSYAASIAAAAIVNLGAREFARRPVERYLLGAAVTLYPLVLIHNAHVLHVEASFKL